ncbi:MAG TPA: hypothetical protein VHX88_12410 [Solirubrobacteraceae bacterium]|nr:hypothetical protein [Solirubrobacteraceae bacterium]
MLVVGIAELEVLVDGDVEEFVVDFDPLPPPQPATATAATASMINNARFMR